MSFQSPLYLLGLLVVPAVLLFALWMNRQPSRYPVAFTNFDVLASVAGRERRQWRIWVALPLFLLALAFATAALAKPRAKISVPEQNATVVFLVDVSGSMRSTDVKPTRLDAAINAMQTLVEKLPKSYKVGLVTFSSEPAVIEPPTADRQAILNALTYLQPQAATALGDGLAAAVKTTVDSLKSAGVTRKPGKDLPAAIVLESDGAQNRGNLSPLQGAELAKNAGIPVDGVALGTPNGTVTFGFGFYQDTIPVPPDPAAVQLIAHVTGGKAYSAPDAQRLQSIYRTLGSSIGRMHKWRAVASWCAGIAAVLLIASLAFARRWSSPLLS